MECRAGDGEESEESVHPKVKEELDRLNQASDEINRLENELDEARSRFSSTRNDSTHQLNVLANKVKASNIKKARPYYEAKEKARKAQEEALKAARQFQSANGIHRAAKETISLAEQKLSQEPSGRVLTSEWQEMFNHATIRLMDAEREKRRSEEEHQMKSHVFSEAEKHMHGEEKKHKRAIARARPYFEMKGELQTKLELLKVAVEALHEAVTMSKRKYSHALSNLETISNQVHEQRKGRLMLHLPREPGVGAESAEPGGGAILRTSFDDPETPSTCQGNFDLLSKECDIPEEDEDIDDDDDVTESSSDFTENGSDVSDVSCKWASSRDIDAEQANNNEFEALSISDNLARKDEQPFTGSSHPSSECVDSENEQTAGTSQLPAEATSHRISPRLDGCQESPNVSQHVLANGHTLRSQEVEHVLQPTNYISSLHGSHEPKVNSNALSGHSLRPLEATKQNQSYRSSSARSIQPVEQHESQMQPSVERDNRDSSKQSLTREIMPSSEKEVIPGESEIGRLEASSQMSLTTDISQQESEIHCVRSPTETSDSQRLPNTGISHHSQQVASKIDNFQLSQEKDRTGQLQNGDESQGLQNTVGS
ncbi:SH3 domain-binding protein 5-like [Liolophura sinensis]|uniref:SH3 domain-binding protein 5-like n=1 Tax=Liolophura sinensis TaxID=3198878 RepID=UPI0031599275